jgi:hypothetical protein
MGAAMEQTRMMRRLIAAARASYRAWKYRRTPWRVPFTKGKQERLSALLARAADRPIWEGQEGGEFDPSRNAVELLRNLLSKTPDAKRVAHCIGWIADFYSGLGRGVPRHTRKKMEAIAPIAFGHVKPPKL